METLLYDKNNPALNLICKFYSARLKDISTIGNGGLEDFIPLKKDM